MSRPSDDAILLASKPLPAISKALPLPIERCRELIGDRAATLTDGELEEIAQHAALMARLLTEIYLHRARET